ncbi:MAG: hypothetical protein ACJ738_02145 [Gaiellales bacterium]
MPSTSSGPRAWQPPPGRVWAVSDEWISFANGRYLIPRRFGFLIGLSHADHLVTGVAVVEVEVKPNGRLCCERLDMIATTDEVIDGDVLRHVALHRVMRIWATRIARPLGGKAFGEQETESIEAKGFELDDRDFAMFAEQRAFQAALAGSGAQRRSGAFPPTTENLKQVANAYRDAMAQGSRNPRKYVAQALLISESTASLRIRAARDHDPPLLGAALGKRPGEAPSPQQEES